MTRTSGQKGSRGGAGRSSGEAGEPRAAGGDKDREDGVRDAEGLQPHGCAADAGAARGGGRGRPR